MTTIAVTGHIRIPEEDRAWIRARLDRLLGDHPAADLTGVSCLAAGADTLFADAVLAAGGRLVAVVPSADYRERMVAPEGRPDFDRLLAAASETKVMPFRQASAAAYAAANRVLLGRADRLVAVWNGRPGRTGGTAHTVAAARAAYLPVTVVWPPGAGAVPGASAP
ncbi:hypothetical protein [Streptomyces sp. NPDC093225]|uniref:hypothetical protein n=1 Tax=Streptomyces sp. NPDC093225 TaxID=3366034 RepID=UPI0038045727